MSANAVGSGCTLRILCADSRRFGTQAGAAGGIVVSACWHGVQSCLAEELLDDASASAGWQIVQWATT